MDNPKDDVKRLSVSLDNETDARVLRLKHALETSEQKRISVSEVVRRALECLEKSIAVIV